MARKPWSALQILGIGLFCAGGCLSALDDPCGPNQVEADGACMCADGFALEASTLQCTPCGTGAITVDNQCVCPDGLSEDAAGNCTSIPAGLGVACTGAAECTSAPYVSCVEEGGRAGYCTNSPCATSSDCQGGFACNTASEVAFCQMPPSGLDKACGAQADCQGFEASYCDEFISHRCVVPGCSLTLADCFVGRQCCDTSAYAGLGVPATVCAPEGECP